MTLAARYTAARTLDTAPTETPAPGPGEVELAPAYVGICGTDLHIFHGDMDTRVHTPAVLGHEMSGRIVRVGPEVAGWAPGDTVSVMPLRWDNTCPACQNGHQHICQHLDFIGIDSPGAMQQRWTVPTSTLIRLPDTAHRLPRLRRRQLHTRHHPPRRRRMARPMTKTGDLASVLAGAGMNQTPMLTRFLHETAADLVMLAGRYTLLDQTALDDVLPSAQQHGKSVVAVGVFNSGLLSRDRPAEGMKYDYQEAPPDLVARARAIADVCEEHGTSLPAAAIAFPATHASTVNVTLGMRNREQVTRNVELQRSAVPQSLWDELRYQGLIRSDVPI
ncbi:aldo/keto reductase [Streptomyces sp. B21-083]|uniref:aldo/keto reductase n=1 Tax=Streptomyces sp. B21-083 TaxID=3039410 RepID=UPI002FEF1289